MARSELATDLARKVSAALERRNDLTQSYRSTRERLQITKAENDHLLDMLAEAYPEMCDDLSSGSSDDDAGAGAGADDARLSRHASIDLPPAPSLHGKRSYPSSSSAAHEASLPDDSLALATTGKRRRLRLHNKRADRSEPRVVEALHRDSVGALSFPIVIGRGSNEVVIHSLGHIVWDRDAYHTSRYIWTPGFKSSRFFPSLRADNSRCTYTSEIIDDGDMPIFQVTAEDMPELPPFRASSSSGAWKQVLDQLSANGVAIKIHASGPKLYGLGNWAITKAIQDLDNSSKCKKYIPQVWADHEKHTARSRVGRLPTIDDVASVSSPETAADADAAAATDDDESDDEDDNDIDNDDRATS
ncbi:hypothetical protein GGI02_003537 [Coemansia sp. RSA 2322]|nr:hypothetical protein GGI02_003537 [Coemansia sp. RSA 2322]